VKGARVIAGVPGAGWPCSLQSGFLQPVQETTKG